MAWPGIVVARLRALWRDLAHRRTQDAEMLEEFRHHIALRTRDLIREGLSPAEAERRARVEFGHLDSHRADARDARGLRLLDEFRFSSLDLILGLRMIRKHPGLSVVSVLGLALAIAIAAGGFGLIQATLDPRLPLPDGDRIVSLQNEEVDRPGIANRRSTYDLGVWREQLVSPLPTGRGGQGERPTGRGHLGATLEHVGGFTDGYQNVEVPGSGVELARIARMHAAGFRVAGVPPLLGRPLLDDDERTGAPPVVVIAEEEWRRWFDADPEVIGRTAVIGGEPHTVVGVMPAGFRFPVSHRYWVPLHRDPNATPGTGPTLNVFGRLAPGATRAAAQAELATIGARLAAEHPDTHGRLRPRVLPYTHAFMDVDDPVVSRALRATQFAISLVLIVVAANVAVLVYARTAGRAGEIAVRTALGAPRRRIVAQLFAEALVLAGVAAVLGLWLAGLGLRGVRWLLERSDGEAPFWWRPGLSGGVIAYVVGLALLAAAIVGILPALTATGRRIQANLQRLTARGSGMALGRTWTALVVTQVAVAVALLPFAVHVAGQALRRATMAPGYAVEQFLRAHLTIEGGAISATSEAEADSLARTAAARFHGPATALLRRLETEPDVIGVTFARVFPGGGSPTHRYEIDAHPANAWLVHERVDVRFFTVLGVRTLAGRDFVNSDARPDGTAVIVNAAFVEKVLNGGTPLGGRVRELRRDPQTGELESGPWREIVGVVPDFTVQYAWDPTRPGLYYSEPAIYQPMTLDDLPTARVALVVRVRGAGAARFTGRLREVAAAVNPALQLHELEAEVEFHRDARRVMLGGALAILAVTASVVLLSAAGISAMMAFTVARRRREIGIRAALGADPVRLLRGIFARATRQLGAGALLGLMVAMGLDRLLDLTVGGSPLTGPGLLLVPLVAALMVAVGLLATWGPARTGLAIQPTEALREE
jgi:predicted permease